MKAKENAEEPNDRTDDNPNLAVPVAFTQLDTGSFRFSGTFTARQTNYGIKPESVAGVVKVKDKVSIRFEIHAQVAANPCR